MLGVLRKKNYKDKNSGTTIESWKIKLLFILKVKKKNPGIFSNAFGFFLVIS